MAKDSSVKLEMPHVIDESKVYHIKRTVNGVKDTLNLFLWSEQELTEAIEFAETLQKSAAEIKP